MRDAWCRAEKLFVLLAANIIMRRTLKRFRKSLRRKRKEASNKKRHFHSFKDRKNEKSVN